MLFNVKTIVMNHRIRHQTEQDKLDQTADEFQDLINQMQEGYTTTEQKQTEALFKSTPKETAAAKARHEKRRAGDRKAYRKKKVLSR